MRESPYYEHIIQKYTAQGIEQGKAEGIEQGIEQGARETSINNILSVLTKRFPLSDVQPIAKALESIEELEQLTELHLTAIDIPSVEAFLQGLDATEV